MDRPASTDTSTQHGTGTGTTGPPCGRYFAHRAQALDAAELSRPRAPRISAALHAARARVAAAKKAASISACVEPPGISGTANGTSCSGAT